MKPVEKRIYVIVPRYLDVPDTGKIVSMSCGRLIAQACHVVSKLKLRLKLHWDDQHTTIVLKVNNTKELEEIADDIAHANVDWEEFRDTNMEYYGTESSLLTAVACYCSRKKGKSLFYHLDVWTCDKD